MSVEARELMTDHWTRWQGYVVNGVYRLGRHLGGSEFSGVFMTRSGSADQGDVAIKLIPAIPGQEAAQLGLWAQARAQSHPHLLSLFDMGACQLGDMPFLYVVMEYAGQTLDQLLSQRALTPGEAREMLSPVLDALTFLHDRGLVQGALKPANLLVVGDELKLASDMIRRAGEGFPKPSSPSAHVPPEALSGTYATSGDLWGMGVTLFEALTRRALPATSAHRTAVSLPADFSPEFHDAVERCLSHKPPNRPSAKALADWVAGAPLAPAQALPDVKSAPSPTHGTESRPQLIAPVAIMPSTVRLEAAPASLNKPVPWVPAVLVATGVLVLAGIGTRVFRSHDGNTSTEPDLSPARPAEIVSPLLPATTPASGVFAPSPAQTADRASSTAHFVLHESIPSVSKSATQTIHGNVKVVVRAAITADGSVSGVAVDRGARSRYFQRISAQAAKAWKFQPDHSAGPRTAEIEFNFTRDGTSAHAVPSR